MNLTKASIDMFARMGLAYDLKTVPEKIIHSRVHRTGDGTHPFSFEDSQFAVGLNEEEVFSGIIPK